MSVQKPQKAIDLSHHLSDVARARRLSPLKGLQKLYLKEGSISLAGGLPSPAYFPFSSISAEALITDSFPLTVPEPSSFSWLWRLFTGSPNKEKTKSLTIPKYPLKAGDLSLSTTLQYSPAVGIPALQKFITEFTTKAYQPGYEDFANLVHTGNTDGWFRCVITLCNSGEGVLTDDWTYPSAIETMHPFGVEPVPVLTDSEGMRSGDLRRVLSEWDASARGMPRPHVMYVVPIGQNPSGSTMGAVRKQEIYDICVEYDIIIVEDDPYYFLQQSHYIPEADRAHKVNPMYLGDEDRYLAQLEPTFLKLDYQGRVIRLDTFSKTIAPGCRLGWFTCNPIFAEKLERQGETTSQAPCGFSQSFITSLLLNWGYEGFIRWLRGLGSQYSQRRDFIVDCLANEFHLQITKSEKGVWEGSEVYIASTNTARPGHGRINDKFASSEGKTMLSFVPPTSGMFIWLKIHLENHPAYTPVDEASLEMTLWKSLAEAGVLFAPGHMFSPEEAYRPNEGHFRISFSNCELDDMKKAITIFGRVLREFFGEQEA